MKLQYQLLDKHGEVIHYMKSRTETPPITVASRESASAILPLAGGVSIKPVWVED